MQRLYYLDTYKFKHNAIVTGINGNIVELDATIFHPQGGGQPNDIGTINKIPVTKIIDLGEAQAIQHELAQIPDFKVGDRVELEIDPETRLLFARLHTAGHLLAHIAQTAYPELTNPKGHHFPGEARVQFDYTDLPAKEEISKKLLDLMASAIKYNAEVVSEWDAGSGRTVTIGDFVKTPCGGTHLKGVAEIGGVEFRKVEAKKGVLKLSYNVL